MKIDRIKDKTLNTWIWKADFWYKKKKYRPTAFSKSELDNAIIAIKQKADKIALGLEAEQTITIKQLLDKHSKELGDADKNKKRAKTVCAQFVKKTGANLLVTELTDAEIYDYIRWRKDARLKLIKKGNRTKPIRATSINKELSFILTMLKNSSRYFREMKGYAPPAMPWEKNDQQPRERIISDTERVQILIYLRCSGRHGRERIYSINRRVFFADMFEIALNTAMRWGEIARLEWSFVFFDKKIIKLPKEITKTGVGRVVYLNSRSVEILTTRKTVSTTSYVFPSFTGEGFEKYAHAAFQRYCNKLGLDFSLDGFTLHTTRHTAITELLERSGDFAATQAQAGHSDRSFTARYAHARADRMHSVVENLVKK